MGLAGLVCVGCTWNTADFTNIFLVYCVREGICEASYMSVKQR